MVIVFLKYGTYFIALAYTLWPIHLTKNLSPALIFPWDADGEGAVAGRWWEAQCSPSVCYKHT